MAVALTIRMESLERLKTRQLFWQNEFNLEFKSYMCKIKFSVALLPKKKSRADGVEITGMLAWSPQGAR